MKSSGAALFPLALMALLAAMTFWLERATSVDDANSRAKGRHDPDFIVERFQVRRFKDDGKLQHTLVAEKMLHFPDDESTDVIAPHLTYHRDRPTVVTGKTAWLDKDGEHVRLEGDVRVVRAGDAQVLESVLTTSVLHMTPDDEYAHTEAPVTITQGQSVINGSGGTLDNKTQIAVLGGRVTGTIYRKQEP